MQMSHRWHNNYLELKESLEYFWAVITFLLQKAKEHNGQQLNPKYLVF